MCCKRVKRLIEKAKKELPKNFEMEYKKKKKEVVIESPMEDFSYDGYNEDDYSSESSS